MRLFTATVLAATLVAASATTARADVDFARSDLPDASAIISLELGDLDGRDGPDVVTVSTTAGVEVRLNRGDGTFGAPRAFATAGCTPFQVVLGDVADNGPGLLADGRLDAAIACTSGLLGRLPGDGTGAFGAYVSAGGAIGTAGAPTPGEDRLALAYWRRPGLPPVAIYPEAGFDYSTFSGYQILCYSYDWAQNDCSQSPHPSSDPTNIAPGPLMAGEFDGGDVDEVGAVGRNNTLNGYGIDAGPLTNRVQPFGTIDGQPRDIIVGDLEPDGRPDVLTSASSTTAAHVNVIGGEAGRLGYTAVPFAAQPDLRRIALLDADGDQHPDVVGALGDGRVAVQRGDGGGSLAAPQLVVGSGFDGAAAGQAVSLATGDVDRNGSVDVVVAHPFAGTIELLRNRSAATPGPGPGPGPEPLPGTPAPNVPAPVAPKPIVAVRPAVRAPLKLDRLRVDRRVVSVRASAATTVAFAVARCRSVVRGSGRARRRRTVCTTVARLSSTVRRAGRAAAAIPARVSGGSYRVTASARGAQSLVRQLTVAPPPRRRGR